MLLHALDRIDDLPRRQAVQCLRLEPVRPCAVRPDAVRDVRSSIHSGRHFGVLDAAGAVRPGAFRPKSGLWAASGT